MISILTPDVGADRVTVQRVISVLLDKFDGVDKTTDRSDAQLDRQSLKHGSCLTWKFLEGKMVHEGESDEIRGVGLGSTKAC